MKEETRQKLEASLTAENTELLPFLPVLLQDLWQLGGSPDLAVLLFEQYMRRPQGKRILDLACGKGAIAVRLAGEMGVHVKGIDLMPEFIAEARQKAEKRGVGDLCHFEVGDVNAAAQVEKGWDAVVFSASGNILGRPEEMLPKLKATVRRGGLILLDESYLDGSEDKEIRRAYEYATRATWETLFRQLGLTELAAFRFDEEEMVQSNKGDLAAIRRRAEELAIQYPDKKTLFEGYVKSQEAEVYDLEHSLVNVVWLLRAEG